MEYWNVQNVSQLASGPLVLPALTVFACGKACAGKPDVCGTVSLALRAGLIDRFGLVGMPLGR